MEDAPALGALVPVSDEQGGSLTSWEGSPATPMGQPRLADEIGSLAERMQEALAEGYMWYQRVHAVSNETPERA